MTIVELYSKDDCKLCDDVKASLEKLHKDYSFRVREIHLSESDPKYKEYQTKFPVVMAEGVELSGRISEADLRKLLNPGPATALFYVAKFLEALGMVTVLFGFIYGLLGDMWTDLYFFLGGIVVFAVGRVIEKYEEKKRKAKRVNQRSQPAGA